MKWGRAEEKEEETFLRGLVNWAGGDATLPLLRMYVFPCCPVSGALAEMCWWFLQFGASSASPIKVASSLVSSNI